MHNKDISEIQCLRFFALVDLSRIVLNDVDI